MTPPDKIALIEVATSSNSSATALFWLYDGDDALRKDRRFADVKRKMGVKD